MHNTYDWNIGWLTCLHGAYLIDIGPHFDYSEFSRPYKPGQCGFHALMQVWLKPLVRFIQDLKASGYVWLFFLLFTTLSKSNHFTPTSSLICGREACCSCVGSVRFGERARREGERERMRGGSLINTRIRGRCFLFLVWTKIKRYSGPQRAFSTMSLVLGVRLVSNWCCVLWL